MADWTDYYDRVGNAPSMFIMELCRRYSITGSDALDLGAGNLRDAKYLLTRGFTKVIAIDNNPQTEKYVVEGIDLNIQTIETYNPPPNAFDLVYSNNALYYLTPPDVAEVIRRSLNALRSGKIFACTLLGAQDYWVKSGEPSSAFTHKEAAALFPSSIVKAQVKENVGGQGFFAMLYGNPKKTEHTIDIVAVKK